MFKSVGAKLREYRLNKGIGLNQMAEKVGVSPGFLSNFETGKSSSISVNVLDDLISILEISPSNLVDDDRVSMEPLTLETRLNLLTKELLKESRINPEGASLITQQLELGLRILRFKSSGTGPLRH
jgi:transcriptional regulator with XRE-family HTH domain